MQNDDDELALKIAERMWDVRESHFAPRLRVPFSARQTDETTVMARAAIAVMREAGWIPPNNTKENEQ